MTDHDKTERLIADAWTLRDAPHHPGQIRLAAHTRALRADLARVTTENDALRRGLAAAVPDYPHQDPDGSGHPWPLVPIGAVLAVDAKLAACETERRAAVDAAITQGARADRAEAALADVVASHEADRIEREGGER